MTKDTAEKWDEKTGADSKSDTSKPPRSHRVTWAEGVTTKEVKIESFDPHDLIFTELSGRVTSTDLQDLMQSIIDNGQEQAGIVRKDHENRPVIVAGHRRARCILTLATKYPDQGWRFNAKVLTNCNEEKAFILTLAENAQRQDTTAIDDAHNIAILKDKFGKSNAEIARVFGKNRTAQWVADTDRLNLLSSEIQKEVVEGKLSADAARELTNADPKEHREIVEKAKAAQKPGSKKAGKATATAVKAEVRKKVEEKQQKAAATSTATATTPTTAKPTPAPSSKRSMKELRTYLDSKKNHRSATVASWVETMVNWLDGKLTDETLTKRMVGWMG